MVQQRLKQQGSLPLLLLLQCCCCCCFCFSEQWLVQQQINLKQPHKEGETLRDRKNWNDSAAANACSSSSSSSSLPAAVAAAAAASVSSTLQGKTTIPKRNLCTCNWFRYMHVAAAVSAAAAVVSAAASVAAVAAAAAAVAVPVCFRRHTED